MSEFHVGTVYRVEIKDDKVVLKKFRKGKLVEEKVIVVNTEIAGKLGQVVELTAKGLALLSSYGLVAWLYEMKKREQTQDPQSKT